MTFIGKRVVAEHVFRDWRDDPDLLVFEDGTGLWIDRGWDGECDVRLLSAPEVSDLIAEEAQNAVDRADEKQAREEAQARKDALIAQYKQELTQYEFEVWMDWTYGLRGFAAVLRDKWLNPIQDNLNQSRVLLFGTGDTE